MPLYAVEFLIAKQRVKFTGKNHAFVFKSYCFLARKVRNSAYTQVSLHNKDFKISKATLTGIFKLKF